MSPRSAVPAAALLLAAACEGTPPLPAASPSTPPSSPAANAPAADEAVPALRLPGDVRPTAESVTLRIDPRQDRFSGVVEIDVDLAAPRSVIWLHGRELAVAVATVTPAGRGPIGATWKQRDDVGVASLTLAGAAPAGKARIHLEFDAPFERGQAGLYKVSEAGVPYAFTQFESTSARRAFPCFDEPGFKIPFSTTLVIPAELQGVANTHEVSRSRDASSLSLRFAPTPPLPSYLVAFAVGPFDVVSAPDAPANSVRSRPLPVRGVTVKGRGGEIAYALAHTGEILATLEKYFGIEYPYDKLDILAVPGKPGAMENAGAVTFGEALLLMDPKTAPVSQRRSYAGVMAHELAHQWTGDLVTMQWWDDTWLNEAFATWIGNKITQLWDPTTHADLSFQRSVQGAMSADALVSSRAIRQPIATNDDIQNAFDSITYQKGGGVLAMFERWAGPDLWQKGLNAYLTAHRLGNATADDFLDAESRATGKDVKTAFHTFLDQPGLPFAEVSLSCAKGATPLARVTVTRFLPAGSTGAPTGSWQIPMCFRTDLGVACDLVKGGAGAPPAEVRLGAPGQCPTWVFPNADGAGYYRFALAKDDLKKLRAVGLPKLTTREKMSFGSSMRGAFSRGATPFAEVLETVTPLAADPDPGVAEEPMGYLHDAHEWLYGDPLLPRVEQFTRALYGPSFSRLGWTPAKNEDDQTRTLRNTVLALLTQTGKDPALRAAAKAKALAYIGSAKDGALHPEAVDANLSGTVLSVLGEDADPATWKAMQSLFRATAEETVRARLLWALAVSKDAALAAQARELVLDPEVRESELTRPIAAQLSHPETRDAAWGWLKEHFDAVAARLPKRWASGLIGLGGYFCDEAHAADVEAFFTPKIASLEGGPRALALTVEGVRLCAARRKLQEPSARELFAKQR